MILVTQSINDFPQDGKTLETRSRERLSRVVKRKPLKFKTVYRNIKLQGKKHHKRVICYVSLMPKVFIFDEAHSVLKASTYMVSRNGRLSYPEAFSNTNYKIY